METLYRRCAGLDVHSDSVVVCARLTVRTKASHEVRRFSTTTRDLLELGDWLAAQGITHVAMEATGVYWKPIWHILEGRFELVLANAAHIRNVPGRKSDVNDAVWVSDLLAHGLIRASFVPPAQIQDVRDLTRTRTQLVREIAQHTQRIQKTLENANIKLTSVISDIVGTSGRRILKAMIAGETNPAKLAELGSTRLKCPRAELIAALDGRVTAHHRFLIAHHLGLVEDLERHIALFDARIDELLTPSRDAIARLITIPGVSTVSAQVILAEIGTDMTRFPTAGHLLSWAGLVPRLDESAGKRRSTRVRKGAPWLKPVLVQCAWGAARTKGTYYQAQFFRLKARRGPKKAAIAVAASLLTAVLASCLDAASNCARGSAVPRAFARRRPSPVRVMILAFRTSLVRDEVQPPCGHQCACRPILATRLPPRVHALLGNKRRLENPGCQCQPIQIRPKFSDGLVTPAQAKSRIIVN